MIDAKDDQSSHDGDCVENIEGPFVSEQISRESQRELNEPVDRPDLDHVSHTKIKPRARVKSPT